MGTEVGTEDEVTTTEVGPPPPWDPELAATAELMTELMPGEIGVADVPMIREATGADVPSLEDLAGDGAVVVTELRVPGGEPGVDNALAVAHPAGPGAARPALYWIHGGGMVAGSHLGDLPQVLETVADLELVVTSIDYRLAPETPHPGPVEDCYAGLRWVVDHADDLGIDRDRVVVAGASAGGGLAAAVALLARDRGAPALAGQMLVCPMLDDRNDTPSAVQMTGLGVWDRGFNRMGWTALLGDAAGGPDVSPYAAPARAADLSGLPPTYIDVGSAETFRDEDVAYASRIWRAGGDAELHVWPGGFHGFDLFVPDAAISREAADARLRWLRRRLG